MSNTTFAPAFRDTVCFKEEFFERITYNESSTKGALFCRLVV